MDWAETYNEWLNRMSDFPILMKLHEDRVFSCGITRGGLVGFMEECDQWFLCDLPPDNVRQLAKELNSLADAAEKWKH